MDHFGYLDQEYWESAMKTADVRKMNIIGIDWRQSGLCARRLVRNQGLFRTVPMLADGEYMHKRIGRSPEAFFCGKLENYFENMRSLSPSEDYDKGLLLLVSVPESRLERSEAQAFAARLEQMIGALPGFGTVNVILFPRIRTVREYFRSICPEGSGIGVIQVLEEETQFLLHPGQEITVPFGDCLAADGQTRQYYNKPVRYRENNYLYEADRFLWQDAVYASWYQAFSQICRNVFAAQRWEKERCSLVLTGSESALSCAGKALADLEAAAFPSLPGANEVPVYLLEWFCRLQGLEWGEFSASENRPDGRINDGRSIGWSGRDGKPGETRDNIWDI